MKKLLIGLLALGSISSYAGTMTNSKSGQKITFNLVEQASKKSLIIDGRDAGREIRTISLENVDAQLTGESEKKDRNFDPIFMAARGCEEGSQAGMNDCGIGMLFAVGFDLVTLPLTLSVELIHSAVIKKDLKKIHVAVYRDGDVEVNPRRFKRVLELLNL